MALLKEFFAVTRTSVYHVVADAGDGRPMVLKIAAKEKSDIPVGYELKKCLMVAVCKVLITYMPEGEKRGVRIYERRIERVDRRWYGGWTSHIVALFFTQKEALECIKRENQKPCDVRWIKETRRVVAAIGNNHYFFYVCHDPKFALVV